MGVGSLWLFRCPFDSHDVNLQRDEEVQDKYELKFEEFIKSEMTEDPAHDINHVHRVVRTAKELCRLEGGRLEVVLPAAYLHDCFAFPKDHPERSKSSAMAADKEETFLVSVGYPAQYLNEIKHAIVAHSFSAAVEPSTIEAKIVQDADRLDALGAIGISRCLQVGVSLGTSLYHHVDPHAENRTLDDKKYSLDHFHTKLFKLTQQLHTRAAKEEAERRVRFMKLFIDQLGSEIKN